MSPYYARLNNSNSKRRARFIRVHLDTAPKRSAAVLGCEFLGRPRPVGWAWLRDAAKTRRRRRLRYGGSVRLRRFIHQSGNGGLKLSSSFID